MLFDVVYTLVALYIAWIWLDYFQQIDIFDKENRNRVILTLLVGGITVIPIIFSGEFVWKKYEFTTNSVIINDLLKAIVQVALVEEIVKLLGFLLIFASFRKKINEPIDIILYGSVIALGFSTVENVKYFSKFGYTIIDGRSILSTVGHMIDSTVAVYGFILYKYHPRLRKVWVIPLFFFLAILSHGIFDFFLQHKPIEEFGWILNHIYFLLTVSWYAIMIENALSNSPFFTYKKVIHTNKVTERLLKNYSAILVIQIIFGLYKHRSLDLGEILSTLFFAGFLVVVTSARLSRFKLIKNHWNKFTIQLPFVLGFRTRKNNSYENSGFFFKIRGDFYDETHINSYYNEYFYLRPMNLNQTFLERTRICYIEEKYFFKDKDSFYLAKAFKDKELSDFDIIFIKPKKRGQITVKDKHLLVHVLTCDESTIITNGIDKKKFKLKETAMIEEIEKV